MAGECPAADLFGSVTCDCGTRLDASLRAVTRSGHAVLVHLRGGVPHRSPAEGDLDLVAHVLRDLGVRRARLLTVSQALVAGLRDRGIDVRVAPSQPLDRAARATA
jgi:3,4-dihydroxy 2-butanone 4-phosphate synthase/GTP cyclohydrolase II